MVAKEMIKAEQNISVLNQYPEEQIDLLRNQIAPGFTDQELAFGLTVARARNLDPFQKQVYFTKRRSFLSGQWVEKVDVEPTIGGLQAIADRTGELDGEDEPLWCGPDGVWTDVWLDEEHPPVAAKFRVYRKGRSRPFHAVAKYSEYVQRNKEGKPTAMWLKMPANQLMKCAEAKALRRAFPTELGGIYTQEEMAQADNPGRFDSLPQEDREPSKVITIEPKRESRKGEGLEAIPEFIECIPVSIMVRCHARLNGLEAIKLSQMSDEDLELVIDEMRKQYAQRAPSKQSTKLELDWYKAIAECAKAKLAERNNPPPPEEG